MAETTNTQTTASSTTFFTIGNTVLMGFLTIFLTVFTYIVAGILPRENFNVTLRIIMALTVITNGTVWFAVRLAVQLIKFHATVIREASS